MQFVACGHCRTRVAPKADGGCPACGCPVDGTGQPRTVELGRMPDPARDARRAALRHLFFGVALLAGSSALFWLSWIGLRNGSWLWKPVVIVAVAMLFRALWESVEILRFVLRRRRPEPLPEARARERD